jgi:hypothetical protein
VGSDLGDRPRHCACRCHIVPDRRRRSDNRPGTAQGPHQPHPPGDSNQGHALG